jgi:uncharacterized protein YceK
MKKIYVALIGCLLVAGCSTEPLKIGTEYGWYCNNQYQKELDKSKFKKISIPGEKDGSCIQMKADQDTYWDFYIRDYEKDRLPEMPELQ